MRLLAGIVVSGFVWFVLRFMTLINSPALANDVFGFAAWLKNVRIIPESISLFSMPVNIASIPSFTLFKTLSGTVILIILLAIIFKATDGKKKLLALGLFWFLLFLFPSMLYKHTNFDYLNHRFFVSMFGVLMYILALFSHKRISWLWKMFLMVVLLWFGAESFMKSKAYASSIKFYQSAIESNKNCQLAYFNRGLLYEKQGFIEKAINDYSKTIELKPDDSKAWYYRSVLYEQMSFLEEA